MGWLFARYIQIDCSCILYVYKCYKCHLDRKIAFDRPTKAIHPLTNMMIACLIILSLQSI